MREWINIVTESQEQVPSILYHGTSLSNWESIQEDGVFYSSDHHDHEEAACFTTSYAVARRFAKWASQGDSKMGVVLELDGAKLARDHKVIPYRDNSLELENEWRIVGATLPNFGSYVVDVEKENFNLTEDAPADALHFTNEDRPPRVIVKAYLGDEPIGRICLKQREHDPHTLRVVSSDIYDDFQGHGYGRELYLEAIRQGKSRGCDVQSDDVVSNSACGVWRSLRKLGFNVKENPEAEPRWDSLFTPNDKPVFWIET